MWDAHDGMGWWMAFGGVLWVLFIVAIVYLAAGLGSKEGSGELHPRETPLDIAKRRYAAGEISEEEFERIKGRIGGE